MNIVIINDQAHVDGGASQVAIASAMGLARRGYPVTYFAATQRDAEPLQHPSLRVVLTGQYEILNDPSRLRAAVQGIWNARAGQMLAQTLAGMDRADTVVHVHSFTKSLSSSVFRTARKLGFRTVYTLHDYFAACPNGGFFDYPAGQPCGRRPMSLACITHHCDARSYSQKLWRVARQAGQKIAGGIPQGIEHFIYVSEFSRNMMAPYLPTSAHYHFVPNPIDCEKETPIDVAVNQHYLAVGRLSPEKGGVLLAKAAQELPVTFVGDGSMRDEIQRVGAGIHVTGWLSRTEVNQYYRQARALVFPSLWYETQGLVVLEAASRGVPAVVSDGCAARDMIDDGQTGLLFKHGDAADLARKMRLLQDDQLVARLGRNAYQKYWERPSTLGHHLDCLVQVYAQMLPDGRHAVDRPGNVCHDVV